MEEIVTKNNIQIHQTASDWKQAIEIAGSTLVENNDITSTYSERIFSRLIGYYKLIKIVGNDLRINTATNKQ